MLSLDFSYGGFYIEKSVGNNKFSYNDRVNKKIYVPRLIEAKLDQVALGKSPAFIEVEDGIEKICTGLEYMYKLVDDRIIDKEIYLFDNHNQSFYFWCRAIKQAIIKKGLVLLHVDQHKDTRKADNHLVDIYDMEDVARYTNEVLNVGSFIEPAMSMDIFSELVIVDSSYSLKENISSDYVLDLDLDFFSRDMDYIDYDLKIKRVREYIEGARFITIASSPYFIEQDRAIQALRDLFL